MSLREDVSRLLIRLRGDYTRQEVGDALGRSRQAVADLERGEVSLSRLEWLADFYGVDFTIVAIDRRTGRFWNETVAPGLVERIEGGAEPMLMPEDTQRGRRGNGRRTDPVAKYRATTVLSDEESRAMIDGAKAVAAAARDESARERRSHAR